MDDALDVLKQWKLDLGTVREQVYRAPTPRERERWHAMWLLAGGWSAVQVADALERDPHTIGEWLATFRQAGREWTEPGEATGRRAEGAMMAECLSLSRPLLLSSTSCGSSCAASAR